MNLIDLFKKHGFDVIQAGSSFKVNCPFHIEDSPSCSIDESRGMFKCFGCGESGSIEKLLSVLGISELYNSDLLELKKNQLLNKLADSISEFTVYPSSAKPIENTIKTIKPETFKKFNAYTLPNSNSLFFPIRFRGQSRGYIEKILGSKYINHFTNGYIPFNIDRVNSASIILVEGVFDALSVYQAGFHNVMASLSASYSWSLIKWLKQINATNLYILYDGDEAGYKGAKNLHLQYTDSIIINMPQGLDPNDLANLENFLINNGVPK